MDFGLLLHHVPAWLLVFFRLSGIFLLAPMFSSRVIPVRIKVLLVLILSFCVYPMLLDTGRPSSRLIEAVIDHGISIWALIPSVAFELLIGYVIGFAASLPIVGMQIGGQVIDQQVGLSFAGIVNPESGEQSGVVGQLFFLVALTIFILLGGHRVIFDILIRSFDQIPLGGFTSFDSLVRLMVGLLTIMLELSLRIAAPLLCLIFLQTVGMGFLARTVPQMNILSIGFTLRILVGTVLLIAFVGLAANIYISSMRHVLYALETFFAP